MSKPPRDQFDEAMNCETPADARQWLNAEVARYEMEFGKPADEAKAIILANLGYMAGYYNDAIAKKVNRLFGATHPSPGREGESQVIKECEFCGAPIAYDKAAKMWHTVPERRFYCPKDYNIERCEHQPKEAPRD